MKNHRESLLENPGTGERERKESAKNRILIVDDDASVREMLTRVLVGEGYSVWAAANGAILSALCPFDSASMNNIRCVRILVEPQDSATVLIVEKENKRTDLEKMSRTLTMLGLANIRFLFKTSISELRTQHGKFQTVTDTRLTNAG
jgi:chemotaxis response regulator CheB